MKKFLKYVFFINIALVLFLVSCNSSNNNIDNETTNTDKKTNEPIEYYDVYNNGNNSDEAPLFTFINQIHYRFSSIKSSEQKVQVNYGTFMDHIAFSNDSKSKKDSAIIYISDYTNFDEELEFKLYRILDNKKTLLYSFVKPLKWFLSDEFKYTFKDCKNVYEDTIKIEDLGIYPDFEYIILSYYFELNAINKEFADIYCFSDWPENFVNHEFSKVYTMDEAIDIYRTKGLQKENMQAGVKVVEGNQEYIIPFNSTFLGIDRIYSAYNPIFKVLVNENNEIYFELIEVQY